YFQTYVAGAAKRAKVANYNIAVKELTERFGRKDLLIDDHIDSLLSIETIETSWQVSRLRDVYEQIVLRAGCLKRFGMVGIDRNFELAYPNGHQIRCISYRLHLLEANDHAADPGGC
ncbi:hypothetical protein MTO96_050131, partial [Rhipicephalus appendiculatus]